MELKKYDISYTKSITSWDEGLPLGDGKLGCLIYGDGPIRFALDRVDLWDTRPHPNTLEKGFTYQNLVKLSTSGKKEDWAERDRLFEEVYAGFPYPSKITAGRIELDFGEKREDVVSHLAISRAIATMCFGDIKIEAFASATNHVIVVKVGGMYALNVHLPEYITSGEMGYPPTKLVREGGFTYYKQNTPTGFSYGIVLLEKQVGDVTELYITIATNATTKDFINEAKNELLRSANIGYATLKKRHTAWWNRYWKKSEISLEDTLIEKVYYRSYYLFASCSRKGFYPMPLQGVWTADNDKLPPWKGDYHHDTNTQLSYQSYLKANRLQEGENFIDYLWGLKEQFERVSRQFYGTDGLIIPGVSTIDGKPMGGWAQYALSPTMTIWSAQSFDEYYLYTGNKKFLKEKAYPFFKKVAESFLGILEERNGKLYLPISTSPEIHDAEPNAYLLPNTNFDLALLRYLFKTLCDYCEILGKDGGMYALTLKKLDEIATISAVDTKSGKEKKYISLDRRERLTESHRHFSHLMCLYPLHLINYDTQEHKQLYRNALQEIENLGTDMWVGFSFAMCAQIYAMAEMGEKAYEKLYQFADGFVAENGFHLNGDFKNKGYSTFHYRPFTLESSFGYCDALQEMLLQEHQGYIHLFPAIPKKWQNPSFKNLRSYGGALISAEWKAGAIVSFSILPKQPTSILVYNNFGKENLSFSNGQTIFCKQGEKFLLNVKEKTYLLEE